MIRATGLTLRRGTKVLLDDAEFVVHPGERVGIVGKNGAGKSSLFALLTGALDLDAGNLALPAGASPASNRNCTPTTALPANSSSMATRGCVPCRRAAPR